MRMRNEGKHIVTSAIEHISVLNIMKALEKAGFEVTLVPPTNDGFVDLGELERALRKDTVLVSVMYANNEIGTLQPIDEIGTRCWSRRTSTSMSTPSPPRARSRSTCRPRG